MPSRLPFQVATRHQRRGGVPLAVLVAAVGAGEVLAGLGEVVRQLAQLLPGLLEPARLGRDPAAGRDPTAAAKPTLLAATVSVIATPPVPPRRTDVRSAADVCRRRGSSRCARYGETHGFVPTATGQVAESAPVTDPEVMGREAEQSDWLDHAVRAGLVAYGVVHLLHRLARRPARARRPQRGGQRQGRAAPSSPSSRSAGPWSGPSPSGCSCSCVWRVLEAAFGHRDEEGSDRVRKRVASGLKAAIYAALGVTAVRVATGSGRLGQGLARADRQGDGPARRAVARGGGRPRDHRVRRQLGLARLEGEVRRAPRDRGQARLERRGVPAPRQGRLHRQGRRPRHRRRAVLLRRDHPRGRTSPAGSTRRCRRCSSSRSGPTC